MRPRLRLDKRLSITRCVAFARQRLRPRTQRAVQGSKHTPSHFYGFHICIKISVRTWAFEEPEIDERRIARIVGGEFDSTRVTLGVDLHHGEVEVRFSGAWDYVDGFCGPVTVETVRGKGKHHEVALVERSMAGFEHDSAEGSLDIGSFACFPLVVVKLAFP